jgi:hypothetical protein
VNLFVAPLEIVTERDVEEFLGINLPESQRLSEGPRLDFNTLIPENIGEDVAAFARLHRADEGLNWLSTTAFEKTLSPRPEPPAGLTHAFAGLWWDAKGDWTRAQQRKGQ